MGHAACHAVRPQQQRDSMKSTRAIVGRRGSGGSRLSPTPSGLSRGLCPSPRRAPRTPRRTRRAFASPPLWWDRAVRKWLDEYALREVRTARERPLRSSHLCPCVGETSAISHPSSAAGARAAATSPPLFKRSTRSARARAEWGPPRHAHLAIDSGIVGECATSTSTVIFSVSSPRGPWLASSWT